MEYSTEIDRKLNDMKNYELADIFRELVACNDDISELVEKAIDREKEDRPRYAELRSLLSDLVDGVYDDESYFTDDFLFTDSDDYSTVDIADLEYMKVQIGKALEALIAEGKAFDGVKGIFLVCRIMYNSGKVRAKALLHSMQEYLTGKLIEVFNAAKPLDREALINWALDFRYGVPEYKELANNFIAGLDDRRSMKLLSKVYIERLKIDSRLDIYKFEDAYDIMMKLHDWEGIERLCDEYSDDSYVTEYKAKMYFHRRMYDKALECYSIYLQTLKRDENYSCMDDLMDFLDENGDKFSDRDLLYSMYFDTIFGDTLAMLPHVQTMYRMTPDNEKASVKERLLERYPTSTDDYKFRAFATDDEIIDAHRNGRYSKEDLYKYCSDLRCDMNSFRHKPRDIRYFASLVRECLGEILVYEDIKYVDSISDLLEYLATKMGKVGRNEAQDIIRNLDELTAFNEEIIEELQDYDWFEQFWKEIDS